MGDLIRDVRYGVRMLVKAPVLTLIAAGSLALGIAACASMFSVAWGFLYAPFPYEQSERLALLQQRHRADPDPRGVSPANFLDVAQQLEGFTGIAAWRTGLGNLTDNDQPEQVGTAEVYPGTFTTLGRPPARGRGFQPSDSDAGAVVITHDLWTERFGSDPDMLGRTLELDGRAMNVVGIAAPSFEFLPADVDVFVANDFSEQRDERAARSLLVMGRLAPGNTFERASAEVARIFGPLAQQHPEANRNYSMSADPLRTLFPGPSDTRLVQVLMAVAFFVLIIAGANVANLLLARAEMRQKEVSLRTALGAGRRRLLRQLLTESVLLALLGGVAGFLLALWSVKLLATAMPAQIPPSLSPRITPQLVLFTAAVSTIAGLLVGVGPALQSLGGSAREVLTEGSRGGTASRATRRLRSGLVVGQVAVALALLVGSGVLGDLVRQMIDRSEGYTPEGLLTFRVSVQGDQYEDLEEVTAFHEEVSRAVGAVAGARGIAVMNELPRGRNTPFVGYELEGVETAEDVEPPAGPYAAVNPEFFSVMGIALVEGRGIDNTDREDTRRVVVVNRAFMERHRQSGASIGSRVLLWDDEPFEIVGVADDVLHARGPDDAGGVHPTFYVPLAQRTLRNASYAVRTDGDPLALAADLRVAVASVDPTLALSRLQTQTGFVRSEMAGPRAIGIVMAIFGLLALGLSSIGIYGVMAHSVVRRTREIGIRMALGARGRGVVGMVTRQGLWMTVIGLVLGAPLAYGIVRFASGILPGTTVRMGNPALYGGILLTLLGVTALASWLPALRAARVEPMVALQRD